jgi:AraC family transcriptional regulator of adaptative response/methylated-DNA-[protein]-cysteine methyltransferase
MQERTIVYRDFESPLGKMIGGADEKGLCFLEWHDRGGVERIKARVAKRYGDSLEPGSNRHLDRLEKELAAYFAGRLREFSVPIDVTGSPFEQQVWAKLQEIPYGETRSYGRLAMELGKRGGSRAVGRANGANYLAIVIPCHRVIEAGGKVGGYGGKVYRKKYLLNLEAGALDLTTA